MHAVSKNNLQLHLIEDVLNAVVIFVLVVIVLRSWLGSRRRQLSAKALRNKEQVNLHLASLDLAKFDVISHPPSDLCTVESSR